MMDDFFFSLLLAGISVGAVYALIALGLNLTFWTTKTMNFGQGSLMMLCAMLTVFLSSQGLAMALAVIGSLLVVAAFGVFIERWTVRPALQASGGSLSPAEVQQQLGLSGEGVRKRRDRKRLLGWRHGKQSVYPAFQFDLAAGRVWSGLETVLLLLDTDSGPAQLRFFLSPDPELGDTPASLLCRSEPVDVEAVSRKARQFACQLAR
jgi:hypothetical protein